MKYIKATTAIEYGRYGKPWLAICVDRLTTGFRFIRWDGRPNECGEFEFEVDPGTLLASGTCGKGIDGYHLAMPDGALVDLYDDMAHKLRRLPVADRSCGLVRLSQDDLTRLRKQKQQYDSRIANGGGKNVLLLTALRSATERIDYAEWVIARWASLVEVAA